VTAPNTPTSSLATWLDTLLDKYKSDRSEKEKALENCLKHFKGEDIARWKSGEGEGWRSNAFIRMPKQKVWSALSTIYDVLIRNGEIPFSLVKSPYKPPVKAQEQPEAQVDAAINDMTDIIKQDLRDRKADREIRKKILSMAVYGETYTRFDVQPVERIAYVPVDYRDEAQAVEGMEMMADEPVIRWELTEWAEEIPGHSYVSVWSIFTDQENPDLQKNQGVFEVDSISPHDLISLKGQADYIDEEIDTLINEMEKEAVPATSEQAHLPPHQRSEITSRFRYEPRATFWGRVPDNIVKDFMAKLKDGSLKDDMAEMPEGDSADQVEIRAEICAGRVIRFSLNPEGKRPYKHCPWEPGLDGDRPMGVVENIAELVTLLNGVVRTFMDNKSLSANVMAAVKSRFLAPGAADTFEPGKKIEVSEAVRDVREAIQQIIVQDVGESLLSALSVTNQLIEDVSQVPKILQGSVLPKQKSDTAYEMAHLIENARMYLGMVIANIDDYIIEPELMDLYHYHMADPDYQGAKGSLVVHANGSVALQNKVIRVDKLMQLLSLILSSELIAGEVNLARHLEELYRASNLDPEEYLKSEEEKQAEQQRMMEMQAQAEAKAMQQLAQQAQIEAKKEMQIDENESALARQEQTHKIRTEIEEERVEHQHEMQQQAASKPKDNNDK
jgi:hypothetical protein